MLAICPAVLVGPVASSTSAHACSCLCWLKELGGLLQIFVFFADDGKVGVNTIKTYSTRMKEESVSRAIMVSAQALTPFARQCVLELQDKFHIEPVSTIPELCPQGSFHGASSALQSDMQCLTQ